MPCLQAKEQLIQLLAKLRAEDASLSDCAAAVALQHINQLQQQHAEVLSQHEQHLLASELFKDKSVVMAVHVRCQALRSTASVAGYDLGLVASCCH